MFLEEFPDLRCLKEHLNQEPDATHKMFSGSEKESQIQEIQRRYVFYQTSYEPEEVRKLDKVQKVLLERATPLPSWWREGDNLRFLHGSNMRVKAAVKVVIET